MMRRPKPNDPADRWIRYAKVGRLREIVKELGKDITGSDGRLFTKAQLVGILHRERYYS